jgi:CheY-like chemotaxis protein
MTRVLIVDDEKSIRLTLQAFLERAGFDVNVAADGKEALRTVEAWKPNIVVTDIVMPEEDGLALVRHLRERFPEIPFVVMSGANFSNDFHLGVAKAFGASAVLRKPFDNEELVAILHAIERDGTNTGQEKA